MKPARGLVSVAALGLFGCVSDSNTIPPAGNQLGTVASQTEPLSYDFTTDAGRAAWLPTGLTFESVAGPYAVYRVTGASQMLVGPTVSATAGVVSAGSRYFAASAGATDSKLYLLSSGTVLHSYQEAAAPDGACVGNTTTPIPPGDGGGGSSDGGTSTFDMAGAYGSPCVPQPGGPHSDLYSNPGSLTNGGWNSTGCDTDGGTSVDMASPTSPGQPADGGQPIPVILEGTAIAFDPPLQVGAYFLISTVVLGSDTITHKVPASVVCCLHGVCKPAESGDTIL